MRWIMTVWLFGFEWIAYVSGWRGRCQCWLFFKPFPSSFSIESPLAEIILLCSFWITDIGFPRQAFNARLGGSDWSGLRGLWDDSTLIDINNFLDFQSVSVNFKTPIRQDAEFILSCEAQGSPKMVFRWYKNGVFLNTTKATRWVRQRTKIAFRKSICKFIVSSNRRAFAHRCLSPTHQREYVWKIVKIIIKLMGNGVDIRCIVSLFEHCIGML